MAKDIIEYSLNERNHNFQNNNLNHHELNTFMIVKSI